MNVLATINRNSLTNKATMITKIKIMLFLAAAVSLIYSCQSETRNPNRIPPTTKIGQQFKLKNIVDTSGTKIDLDFSKSEMTIIDIWNNTCPPCIEEMKQFPSLIKGKESKISIYSISITQFWKWKSTLKDHKGAFAFLDYDVPNWKQYNLMTEDNPKFNNDISADRLAELDSLYEVKGNPAYFVIDKTGNILSRPQSAVTFLKELKL